MDCHIYLMVQKHLKTQPWSKVCGLNRELSKKIRLNNMAAISKMASPWNGTRPGQHLLCCPHQPDKSLPCLSLGSRRSPPLITAYHFVSTLIHDKEWAGKFWFLTPTVSSHHLEPTSRPLWAVGHPEVSRRLWSHLQNTAWYLGEGVHVSSVVSYLEPPPCPSGDPRSPPQKNDSEPPRLSGDSHVKQLCYKGNAAHPSHPHGAHPPRPCWLGQYWPSMLSLSQSTITSLCLLFTRKESNGLHWNVTN